MNKEFGSTLCDKLSHMVQEGGKGSCGWLPGEVINESHFVPPVLELVLMILMKQGDVVICAGTDL